jgi:hypothetical protein
MSALIRNDLAIVLACVAGVGESRERNDVIRDDSAPVLDTDPTCVRDMSIMGTEQIETISYLRG